MDRLTSGWGIGKMQFEIKTSIFKIAWPDYAGQIVTNHVILLHHIGMIFIPGSIQDLDFKF